MLKIFFYFNILANQFKMVKYHFDASIKDIINFFTVRSKMECRAFFTKFKHG